MSVATRDRAVGIAAAAGVFTGLASTYPWELGAPTALLLWAAIGVLLGLLVGRAGRVRVGAGYGVCLTLAFLYSRFGGAAGDLPAYTVFVLAMSIGGALAGVVAVYAGTRIRARA